MPPRMHGRHGKDKPKNFKKSFFRMIKDFKKQLPLIIVVVLLSIISAILTIYAAVYMKQIMAMSSNNILNIDSLTNTISINWQAFVYSFGLLLALYIGSSLISFISQYLAVNISSNYAYNMRQKVQRKLNFLPLSYFDRVPYGDTLSIGTNDVDNISRNLTSIITQTFTSFTLFFGTLISMFVVQWQLALVAIASIPFTLLVVFCISKFSGKQFINYRHQLGVLNGQIEETYAGYRIIKLFNKEEDTKAIFEDNNKKLAKSDYLSQFLSGFIFPSTFFINNLSYVAIAVVGGLINDAASMLTFFLFLNLFSRPFQQIGQIFNVIQSVVASGERIYNLLDEEEAAKDGSYIIPTLVSENNIYIRGFNNIKESVFSIKNPFIYSLNNKNDSNFNYETTINNIVINEKEVGKHIVFDEIGDYKIQVYKKQNLIEDTDKIYGKFSFKNVYFKYVENKPLIEDFNLEVNKGDLVAIVGPTGAGKTTMVNLIMRFYDLNSGQIYLDDLPITDYSLKCLRGSIGMVLQDSWLFKGSIKDNLLFGNQNATNEELIEGCKQAHIYDFIETLPNGFDFMLDEDGTNISQGQRQLLTIARAIISKPKIMILDEATSSVDTRTESQIQDALNTVMKDRTSFVIAHRLSTIKNAKLIIVMKKGKIVEIGNHYDLLAKKGFYYDLYSSQFAGINPMANNNEQLES